MRVVRWWWLWCAFLPSLLLSQTGSVPADFHVAESRMKLLLSPSVRLQLPLESHAGRPTSARIYLEILRADDGLVARTEADVTIAPGSHTLDIPWEKVLSAEPQPDYYWYRLRYKIVPADHQLPEQQGIVQLSQIVPAVFRMQVSGLKRPQRGSMLPVRVHVDDPRTGKGHAGVQVEAVWDFDDQEKRPAPVQGSTDSHGNATLNMKVPRAIDSDATIKITARKDTWQRTENIELELKERFNVSLTTDKPIYQPGQLLHMRALVLGADDYALSRANVTFTINSPDEDEVFTKEAQTSEFGVAQVDWQIPQKIRIGDYGIKAGVDDSNPSTFAQVRISRYELPQFTVNATADQSYYLPGEPARVEVNAGYLFGQPVKRGTVRIVRSGERSWNREKREYQQEDKEIQQGELDISGKFTAALDLKTDFQDLNNKDYLRYQDVRLAAYVTDLSTNRTEQRHFTVRTSKDRIHIYAFGYSAGPPDLFITTAFPDGAPASADVTITAVHAGPLDGIPQPGPTRQEIGRIHTNKYGVGHFHSNVLLGFFKDTRFSRLELLMEATDRHGNHGAHSEQIWSSGDEYLRITALHALLRDGESINASIESSLSEEQIYVDALSDGKVLATRKVRLRHGHASVEFPYQQEFRKSVLLVAYKPDFSDDERSLIAAAEVLFPEPQDLDPGVHLQRATYKPGEPALAKFRVRSPEGKPVRSALGIVVYDKAVAERVRSDQEFGRYGFDYDNRWDGYNRIAGVTYRNLLNRKLTAPVPPDLELLAEAVLANSDSSQDFRMFAEGDRSYDWDASRIFGPLISRRVGSIESLLNFIYNSSYVCPQDMAELRHTLSANGVNLDDLRDPWGMPYRAEFSLKDRDRVLEFMSSGPDKLPNTADDFVALKITRPYFELIGRKMNAVLQEYASDGKYIRDFETLSRALQLKGIDLKSLKDPWGNTYTFDFGVEGTDYVIHVRSAGPNGVFAQPGARVSDDVREWTSFTRYFQHETGLLNAALADHFRRTGHFPAGENELLPVLNAAGLAADALLDPWGRPYHFRFREMSQYSDHISIYQATGDAQRETSVTPVTRKLGVIEIVSYGEKNDPGQGFPVATFYRVLSEQSAASPLPEAVSISQVPGTGGSGAISGTVTDPQGAVIAGAGVRATDTYTGQQYVTTTDGNGHYELNNLPAGRYQVVISSPGFMTSVIAAVPVSSSNLTRVDARLSIGTTSATVEVSAQAFQVETTSSMVTVSRHDHNVHVQAEQQAFTPRVRKYFPETLVWNPELVTDQSGNAELKFQMADNITTWKMSVIASTVDGQMGIAEKELRTFQPFFIDHEPPRVLTQGDQIQLPVVLRNYLPRPQEVDVSLQPAAWFSLLSAPRQQVKIAAGDDAVAQFLISADRSVREGQERVTAANRTTGDAVERAITVHPDGEEVPQTATAILSAGRSTLDLAIPANAIPGSIDAELRIYPNLGAHVLGALEAMARRPAGCAEQITSIAFGSVLVLQELRKAGWDGPDKPGNPHAVLARRAHTYITEAYQHLLSLQNANGGFPYWATHAPDIAVTAHVLDFLVQASEFMKVEDAVVHHAAEFLVANQHPQGGWLMRWYYQRPELDPNLSALITRVMAETMQQKKETATLQVPFDKAMAFLEMRIDQWKDPYLVGQYALAASLSGRAAHLDKARELLRQLAHDEGPGTYWDLEANTSPFYSWGRAGRLEVTGLAVRALARMQRSASGKDKTGQLLLDRGLIYLLAHKDRYSGWYSTQASINVLRGIVDAMPAVTQPSHSAGPAGILVNGKPAGTVQLPGTHDVSGPLVMDISSLLQAGTNRIEVSRQGDTSPLQAEVVSTHYIRWADSQATTRSNFKPGGDRALRLNVAFDTTSPQPGKPVHCQVEVERVGFAGYGMMMAEIGLPPGAEVDRQSLQHAVETFAVRDYDVLPDRVLLYVWPEAGGTKFSFDFKPRFGMNAAAAPSTLYDYYNPDARAVVAPARFNVH